MIESLFNIYGIKKSIQCERLRVEFAQVNSLMYGSNSVLIYMALPKAQSTDTRF